MVIRLTLCAVGTFLTQADDLPGSTHAITMCSSPSRVMKFIAKDSDFAVNSFDVAILRMSRGLESRFVI